MYFFVHFIVFIQSIYCIYLYNFQAELSTYFLKESYDPEFWEPVTLQAAVDGIPPEEELWDTVIVDEGQDMG